MGIDYQSAHPVPFLRTADAIEQYQEDPKDALHRLIPGL